MPEDDIVLRVEIANERPLDLIDVTTSLMALAQAFQDYANRTSGEPLPDNLRLYVKELRKGSLIAELVSLTEQASWILKHGEVLGAFVTNLHDILSYFMGRSSTPLDAPTRQQANQAIKLVEPIAKDSGSQLNIQVMEGGTVNIHQNINITTIDANAVQNGARRFLGPTLPSNYVSTDQLMTLEQVKNSASSKTGDRGIIEAISERPVKLQFLSEDAKRRVLELQENPLQCVFMVDVEVRSSEGRPTLYRVISVKDVISKT